MEDFDCEKESVFEIQVHSEVLKTIYKIIKIVLQLCFYKKDNVVLCNFVFYKTDNVVIII